MNNLPDELDFWFKYYHKDTILDALGNILDIDHEMNMRENMS